MIPAPDLLAPEVAAQLDGLGAHVLHWALGLSVPIIWPAGEPG
jgi:hypothetical protein